MRVDRGGQLSFSWLPLIMKAIRIRMKRLIIILKMFIFKLSFAQRLNFLSSLLKSRSQLGQETFALLFHNFKRQGCFVEFGAANGIELSNTYCLEKFFDWTGVLAEPARIWHRTLVDARECYVDKRCVWRETGQKVEFRESIDANFSSASNTKRQLQPWCNSQVVSCYQVETISLNDLLFEYNVDPFFEYLSVDVEGSELEVLQSFDLHHFQPLFVTVEHGDSMEKNHEGRMSGEIDRIFLEFGYRKINPKLTLWDNWYVHPAILTLPEKLGILDKLDPN